MASMASARRLLRAGLLTLAAWLLVGTTIGVVSADDGSSASFVMPEVRLGDHATYDRSSSAGGIDAFGVAWSAVEPMVLADGARHAVESLTTEIDVDELDDDPEVSGMASIQFLYEAGTDRMAGIGLAGDLSSLSETEYLVVGGIPLVQQQTTADEAVRVVVLLPETMAVPDCLFGGIWGGQTITADGTLRLPTLCTPLLAPASGMTLHGKGVEDIDGVQAIHYRGHNTVSSYPSLVGPVDLDFRMSADVDLWLSPSSSFPVRVETTLQVTGFGDDEEPSSLTFAMTSFQRGDLPRAGSAPAVLSPSPPELRFAPTGDLVPFTDSDAGHPFPLSRAVQAARDQSTEVSSFLASHPEAFVVAATFGQVSFQGQPERFWLFTLADERQSLDVTVLQEQPAPVASLPAPLADALQVFQVNVDDVESEEGVARGDLPAQLPTVGSLLERWAWQRPAQGAGQTWIYDLREGSFLDLYGEDEGPTLVITVGRFVQESEVRGASASGVTTGSTFDLDLALLTTDGNPLGLIVWEGEGTELIAPAGTAPPSSPGAAPLAASTTAAGWMPTPIQAAGAGLVAIVVGALYFLWPKLKALAFAGLFSRLLPSQLLDHPGRARLLEVIRAEPGIHFQELVRRSGLASGTAVHHLNKLARGNLIACRPLGRYTCYFPGATPDRASLLAAPVLRSDGARLVFETIVGSPHLSGLELAERTGLQKSTVNYHVQRLTEAGLVAAQRDGRAVRLRAVGVSA